MLCTISELMHLTRDELRNMATAIEQSLPALEPGTASRTIALASLDNIRRVMMLRGLHY